MGKGRWKRDPVTKLTAQQLSELPEELLTTDGTRVDLRSYSDCNIFTPHALVEAADYSDETWFFNKVLTDPSSPFHAHQIKNENGDVVRYFTHTHSAEWAGKQFRATTLE